MKKKALSKENLINQARDLTRMVIKDLPKSSKCKSMQLSDESANSLYTLAWTNLARKKYDDALTLFQSLVFAKPLNTDFWKGLAMVMMYQGKLKEALQAFSWVNVLDVNDPWPNIYACEIFIQLNNQEKAVTAFNIAVQLIKNNPQLKNKIQKKIFTLQLSLKNKFSKSEA